MNKLIKISEEQVLRIKAIQAVFSISSISTNSQLEIIGISVIPQFIEIKPNEIRKTIITKSQFEGGVAKLDKYTKDGRYFINIQDYSEEEIRFFSNQFSNEMLSEIWNSLTAINDNSLTVTLKEKRIKEFVLEHNDNLFKTESEFDSFCKEYELSINSFIVPAKFSELDIKLKEINARLELEQFFARRFLFASELIDKLEARMNEYINNGNELIHERKVLIDNWIKQLNKRIQTLKNYRDYNKLYDMPESFEKIEIKDSQNVNVITGKSRKVKIKQSLNKKSDNKTATRIALWTLIFTAIMTVIALIVNWNKIF